MSIENELDRIIQDCITINVNTFTGDDHLLKAGVVGRIIRVIGCRMSCSGNPGGMSFLSGDSPGGAESIEHYLDARSLLGDFPPLVPGYYDTAVGEDLRMNTVGALNYSGVVFVQLV